MVQKKEYLVNDMQKSANWIEIECLDPDGNPLSNVEFILFLPDGSQKTGTLNDEGYYKAENIPRGECKVMLLGYDSTLGG
jgi:hypothetical protein